MRKLKILLIGLLFLVGCRQSDRVSYNISRDADDFKVYRRVVFYNSIADTFILELTGYCSIEVDTSDNDLAVTCEISKGKYQKHFLGLSDNVTYTVEQLEDSDVNPYAYKLVFKPEMIIPIEIEVGR